MEKVGLRRHHTSTSVSRDALCCPATATSSSLPRWPGHHQVPGQTVSVDPEKYVGYAIIKWKAIEQ